jgi:hypothetical protein
MFIPAVDFPCKFYIELPVISSIKFAYNNNSFTYKDIIAQGTGTRAEYLSKGYPKNIALHKAKIDYIQSVSPAIVNP